jgi:hypothetical protein
LARMGFKEGSGIGKDEKGVANPIAIHVRAGARAGLGKEEEVHRLAEEQYQRQVAEANELRSTFLARQRSNFENKQVLRDVIRGRKACEALDRPLGLHNPRLWPEVFSIVCLAAALCSRGANAPGKPDSRPCMCSYISRARGAKSPYKQIPPEKSIWTDAESGEQVFTGLWCRLEEAAPPALRRLALGRLLAPALERAC